MKTKIITSLILIVAILLGVISAKAQGVRVHKKDGTVIEVPYTELDSISTYSYNETPNIKTFDVNGVTFNMVFVEGGSFEMGATPEQSNGYTPNPNEEPVHLVTLSDYHLGQTEVTQELWSAVMYEPTTYRWFPRRGCGDKYPAYNISYNDCQEFITKLNQATGATFRMPTEAEWEYAARGGKKSNGYIFSGSNNIEEVGWYDLNSDWKTYEVSTKAPNELGIYDMTGNVREWCSDFAGYYTSDSQTNPTGPSKGDWRVYRGGSWHDNPSDCRLARRYFSTPENRLDTLGFRLAL